MLKKILVFVVVFCLAAANVYAKPKGASTKSSSPQKKTAAERVGDEIADSMADVLTGKESKTTTKGSKGTPPGLAKKGKTPPGWDKGQKTGWDKNKQADKTEGESPIRKFIKGLFDKGQEKE